MRGPKGTWLQRGGWRGAGTWGSEGAGPCRCA